jgi:hypothetical protein
LSVEPIPSTVRLLVAEHIRSVLELECLLLLRRDPARRWTAEELARELRIDIEWAIRELSDLARRGFAARDDSPVPHYSYAPSTPALGEILAELAVLYAERRVSVTELIYARPSGNPLKSFADAFRIRKEPPDG